jgi:hypothetical protein
MARLTEKIEVLVKPTVDLESAVACVFMLNLFLSGNGDYVVIQHADGTLELVEVVKV